MYTAAKDPFAQAIAFSTDRGRTWTKYSGNPVIPHIASHNRDPHMFWYEPSKQWMLVLFKDVDNTFCLFSSPNLRQWTFLQDIQMPGCIECPDFFPLAVDGDPAKTKWVLTAANGHYLVGDFDGRHFTPMQDVRQVDYGRNFYAVQTYSDIPASDGRRIQIAWMNGGNYPGMPFNQQMSFPAELTLHTTPDGPRMFRNPVREIELLHESSKNFSKTSISPDHGLRINDPGDLLEIRADIAMGDAQTVALNIHGATIIYNAKTKTLSALGDAPLELKDGRLRLQILVDRTSIETFADGGRVSLTSCFLPDAKDDALTLTAAGGSAEVRSLEIDRLKSAWK
jgi:levanase/fructan beta-fructosidase